MRTFFVILFFACSPLLRGQTLERKIVISKGRFYYTTIDPELQMASLQSNPTSKALSAANTLAVPAGRNYSDPIVPFCWDISGSSLLAINWVQHPMSDRMEALKKIPLSSLRPWGKGNQPQDCLLRSVDLPMLANNAPYADVLSRSNVLEGFFFDGVAWGNNGFLEVICNKSLCSAWFFDGNSWKHSEAQAVDLAGGFDVFQVGQQAVLIDGNGKVYKVTEAGIEELKEKKLPLTLDKIVLIMNKDKDELLYVPQKQWSNKKSVKKQLKKSGILILS